MYVQFTSCVYGVANEFHDQGHSVLRKIIERRLKLVICVHQFLRRLLNIKENNFSPECFKHVAFLLTT